MREAAGMGEWGERRLELLPPPPTQFDIELGCTDRFKEDKGRKKRKKKKMKNLESISSENYDGCSIHPPL